MPESCFFCRIHPGRQIAFVCSLLGMNQKKGSQVTLRPWDVKTSGPAKREEMRQACPSAHHLRGPASTLLKCLDVVRAKSLLTLCLNIVSVKSWPLIPALFWLCFSLFVLLIPCGYFTHINSIFFFFSFFLSTYKAIE